LTVRKLYASVNAVFSQTKCVSDLVKLSLIDACLGGTAAAAPPPFRPGNPALCGSRPLVTPYYCRLRGLAVLYLYAVFVYFFVCLCMWILCFLCSSCCFPL